MATKIADDAKAIKERMEEIRRERMADVVSQPLPPDPDLPEMVDSSSWCATSGAPQFWKWSSIDIQPETEPDSRWHIDETCERLYEVLWQTRPE